MKFTFYLFIIAVVSHEIISTYYTEQCDNKLCEYVNKVTLNVHGFMLQPSIIGYDNMTQSDIIFDLNSFYATYGQEIQKMRACVPYYSYDYNCWNEILGIDYDLPCTNPISIGCPNDEFYSIVPYVGNDCVGKQYRYIEKVFFRNCTEISCTISKHKQLRLSGTIIYNNLTRPFDIPIEYGVLNKISDDIKINVVQVKDLYRDDTDSICADALSNYVVLNLSHHTMDHYMNRRVMDGHLVSNFVRDDKEYDFADLMISDKGFIKNEYGVYLFMYYRNNGTCIPVPYSEQFDKNSNVLKTIEGKTVYQDVNCTKREIIKQSYECNLYQQEGVLDSEGNLFCLMGHSLKPVSGSRLSSNILDDIIIQLSFSGNYAVKQVFYDRCRIKEIEYVNNTIYIYDCMDPVHIKNLYTEIVYKVHNNMTIDLPNGIYSVVDYINAPTFLVNNHEATTNMYYADDRFYVNAMLGLGFSINTIESTRSYLFFYITALLLAMICVLTLTILTIKLTYKVRKCKNTKTSTNTNSSRGRIGSRNDI